MFVPAETLKKLVESKGIDISSYTTVYQQAERLELSGKGTAPDDNFSRVDEKEFTKGNSEHNGRWRDTY